MSYSSQDDPGAELHQFIDPDVSSGGLDDTPLGGQEAEPLIDEDTAAEATQYTQTERPQATPSDQAARVGSIASGYSSLRRVPDRGIGYVDRRARERPEPPSTRPGATNRVLNMLQTQSMRTVLDTLAAEREKPQGPSREDLIRAGIIQILPKH